jgi:hypothetical protein
VDSYAGFEVLTAVVMRNGVFWHITPYSMALFCCLLHVGFLLDVLFDPEDGGDIFPYGVIFQKIKLFAG